jgi:hypothetical protein
MDTKELEAIHMELKALRAELIAIREALWELVRLMRKERW